MTTSEDIIEDYVTAHFGPADAVTKQVFREQLQVLVAVAKSEQLREDAFEAPMDKRLAGRAAVH